MPNGPARGLLQAGESITLEDDTVVTPDEVLGPPRPGRKVVLSGDTAPSPTVLEAARGAEVLVHEATFLDEERERAQETGHATALEAAELAREAEVGLLALTHLSNRYFGPEAAREARTIFPETVVPKDFDVIDVPFPERGSPRLVKGGVVQPPRGGAARARAGGRLVTALVQVALAETVAEAEEIESILRERRDRGRARERGRPPSARGRRRAAESARAGGPARGRPGRDRVDDRAGRSDRRRLISRAARPSTTGCARTTRTGARSRRR